MIRQLIAALLLAATTPALAEPIAVDGGNYKLPQMPGAGTTMRAGALEKVGRPLG